MKEFLEPFQRRILSLRAKENKLGSKIFLGIPDRWFEKSWSKDRWFENPGPKWRCKNDYVSSPFIDSESCCDYCIRCGFPVL